MSSDDDGLKAGLATVAAIPVTPFGADGEIDEDRYRDLVRMMTAAGISVLTPGGNTGEFYALSPAERRRVVELTVEAAPEAIVMAGVGLDLHTAVADAQASVAAGADCLMVHQPVHPYLSIEGWIDYHAQIARAVPEVGIVPYVKDERVDVAAMNALSGACSGVVAVKYAVADPVRFAELVDGTQALDLVWLCGLAERWAPFFAPAGSRGFTSGLATIDPHRSLRMLAALRAGDYREARDQWALMRRFEELRARDRSQHNVSVVKEALAQLGLCSRDVRPPISLVSDAVADEVGDVLRSWGLRPERTTGKGA